MQELQIIVDMQRDFHDQDGTLTSYDRCHPKTGNLLRRVLPAALAGAPVLLTLDTHPPYPGSEAHQAYTEMLTRTLGKARVEPFLQSAEAIYVEERKLYPIHCEYGSDGWQLTEPINALVTVLRAIGNPPILLQKPSYDLTTGFVLEGPQPGLSGAELLQGFRAKGFDRAVIHGLITPVCVHAAAEACIKRGFRTIVPEETVESYNEETHRQGLAAIEALGATVIRSSKS